jgi:glycosyltransferase involved in cell wall biosynthesis
LGIEAVVNGNALLFDIPNIEVPVIYDLVDDHLTPNSQIGLTSPMVGKIVRDITYSAGVVAVSTFLEEKVQKYNSNTTTIENGLYLERFASARSLKRELGLEGKIVYGYIGGVSPWTQIHRAIEEYLKIASPETAFIVVGGNRGSYYRQLVEKYGKRVHFVGAVPPPQVPNYFKTLDVGVIPFELNDFTSNAFPIKSLEYGAGGAYVVSTPLKYLQSKKFPFITFAPIEDFASVLEQFKMQLPSLPPPSHLFDFSQYDWKKLGKRLESFIAKSI